MYPLSLFLKLNAGWVKEAFCLMPSVAWKQDIWFQKLALLSCMAQLIFWSIKRLICLIVGRDITDWIKSLVLKNRKVCQNRVSILADVLWNGKTQKKPISLMTARGNNDQRKIWTWERKNSRVLSTRWKLPPHLSFHPPPPPQSFSWKKIESYLKFDDDIKLVKAANV